ncbi:ankyrin repeat-containing domain protein [Aspergillus pseudodeflectus]|uniref:Ankyrin repeat-containing domain protein n=1 Tax=Aspergillus pseudodeflectus TaxID=176178 RepID=A0ABR4KSG4_9EURO
MERNNPFFRAFHDACYFNDLSKPQEAIATGRLTDEDLDEGLQLATLMAHADIVTALFAAGARVTTRATGALPGENNNQDPDIIRQFLERGLDPNARLSSGEPLLPMVLNPAGATVLLSARADPNLRGPRGIAPLARAIVGTCEPDTSLLELYLANGAKLEPVLLSYAVTPRVQQNEVMTRFLLDRGVDPNGPFTDAGGRGVDYWGTPLHCAVWRGRVDLVKLLLEAGADPDVVAGRRKFGTKAPAEVAERVGHRERREEIHGLLQSYSRREPSNEPIRAGWKVVLLRVLR